MKKDHLKLQIYKGMVQYLLDSTKYNLKNIAALTNTPPKHINSIYYHHCMPLNFSSEQQLIKLYQIILEINTNENKYPDHCPQQNKYQPLEVQ